MSDCGIGTRSEVKKLIRKFGVSVNGSLIKAPEFNVGEADQISYRGEILAFSTSRSYLFHKPAGCITANSDEKVKTVLDFFPAELRSGLSAAGRLDKDTEGLLILTTDGSFLHHLISPRHKVEKTYFAILDQPVPESAIPQFSSGIDIGDEKLTAPAALKILGLNNISAYISKERFCELFPVFDYSRSAKHQASTNMGDPSLQVDERMRLLLEHEEKCGNIPMDAALLTISEGRYHQVKRMFQAVGCKVLYLKRISEGPLELGDLKPGEFRPLTEEEILELKK